jgi:nucleotide-binding universal stress UspA family protein
MGFHSIIVGAALDDRDATTFRHAAQFARAAQTKVVYAAHVARTFDLPPEIVEKQPDLVVPVDEEIAGRLQALIAAHRSEFPETTDFHVEVRQGSMVEEMVRLTAQKSADLFCLGRRPHADHDRLSDAAMQLLWKTPCSVFVAPPEAEPRYERILAAVDFSEHSREALEVAFTLAKAWPNATVTIQHTYEVPLGWHKSSHSYEEFAAIMKKNAEDRFARLAPKLDAGDVPWSIRYDLGESIPKTVLAAADEIDANLIVLGSHGRTRPAGFLLGHVADAVCARTARPVLCVKRKGEVVNFLHGLLQFFQLESS